jgi:hypothetical protein
MGDQDTRSRIRVGKPKPIKDLNLPCGHFPRLGAAYVVKPEQMQHAMDRHVRPMRLVGLALQSRFVCDHGRADHELSQEISPIREQPRAVEGQNVGGPILVAVARVQGAAARRADHSKGDHRTRCSAARNRLCSAACGTRVPCARQRRTHPLHELRASRHPRAMCRIRDVDLEPCRHRAKRRRRAFSLRRPERFFAQADVERRRGN